MKSKSIYNERYVCLLFGGGVIVTWRLGSMQLEFWGRLLDILGLCFFVACIWYFERVYIWYFVWGECWASNYQ